jgi:hypothetical protein
MNFFLILFFLINSLSQNCLAQSIDAKNEMFDEMIAANNAFNQTCIAKNLKSCKTELGLMCINGTCQYVISIFNKQIQFSLKIDVQIITTGVLVSLMVNATANSDTQDQHVLIVSICLKIITFFDLISNF